jgi:hypothetical protein
MTTRSIESNTPSYLRLWLSRSNSNDDGALRTRVTEPRVMSLDTSMILPSAVPTWIFTPGE